jgi:phage terminase large subunit-like protein
LKEALLNRQTQDPLFNFDLFSPQTEFVKAVADGECTENYYIGANRSGKSDAGAYAGAQLARFGDQSDSVKWARGEASRVEVRDRATSGWVSALDFPTSRDTIQPKYFDNGFMPPGQTHEPFIPKHEILDWRVADQILRLKNGSIIGFKSADSGRSKYQGAEKDWVHLDEEHPESIYDEILIRIGARKLRLFITCTLLPPEGQVGGITWIFNRIVKPWKAGTLEGVQIFNASIYDNPHLPTQEIERLETRYPEGSIQRRIRLNGELIGGLSGARVYSTFDHQLNVRQQPEIQLRRPLAWVWDFNVEPMVSIVGQRDPTGLFRVFKELIIEEGNLAEMCELFRSYHNHHLAEVWVYGDASGRDRSHQTKFSSYQIILNEMRDYPAPIKLKVPEKNPSVVDRINAMNMAFRDDNKEVKMEVDPSCEELISDFEQVISDGKGGIKKTHNRKDPYFKRTHTSDALGYWIYREAPVRPISVLSETVGSRQLSVPRPSYGT